jgi:hypothetical protein
LEKEYTKEDRKTILKKTKDLKYLQNPELLAKKHKVSFEDTDTDKKQLALPSNKNKESEKNKQQNKNNDDLNEESGAGQIHGSISTNTAKRLNESVNMMIQTINDGNKKKKKNSITSILPGKLKSICSADLNQKRLSEININIEAVEKERRRDIIYNLMTNNTAEGLRLLDSYVILIYQTLLANGLYPKGKRYADDAEKWDRGKNFLVETKAPQFKRGFIWAALYICPYVADLFCPKDGASQFLTDPTLLTFFIKDKSSPFLLIFTDLILPTGTAVLNMPSMDIETFSALATFEWIKLLPWRNMATISSTPPLQISKELRMTFQPESIGKLEAREMSTYMNIHAASGDNVTEDGSYDHHVSSLSIEDTADS